jgi:CubicO group peptidase (beta-lactamase class C family)
MLMGLSIVGVLAACTNDADWSASSDEPSDGAAADDGTIDTAAVDAALEHLDADVTSVMERSGVPGLAVAVVHDGEVVFAQGYGVRELGRPEPVDADTVFQLASVSKSVGSAVMASMVGDGVISWDEPVRSGDPGFTLSDPWVSEHVTYADLYAHRSGLPGHIGDVLEDVGYDRAEVIERLRDVPLDSFRASYHYTNFGLTAAADAAATLAGTTWEQASEERLYEPLGMTSTSSTFEAFMARPNRASGHVPVAEDSTEWRVTDEQREPDAQSPAGGVSSSVNDLARWMQLEIDGGSFDGEQVIDAEAIAETHVPQIVSRAPTGPNDRAGFYGLGFNVGYDAAGRVRLGHSGAFALGAGTAFAMYPGEGLGIVVLTNGAPLGIAEAVVETFTDRATTGEPSRDWLAFVHDYFAPMVFPVAETDFDAPPADAAPSAPLSDYVGSYRNDFIGVVECDVSPLPPVNFSFPVST